MTTAQVLPGIKLLRSIPSPNYRLYSSATKTLRQNTKERPQRTPNRPGQSPNRDGTKGRPKTPRIFIPPANDHVLPSGRLLTTPEVWSFLQETGIEYDNSKATRLHLGPDEQKVKVLFNCLVQYSPRYILHPYHLQHLRPGIAPMLPIIMSNYRRKLTEEPLWTYTICRGGGSTVVRHLMAKRLTGAFWRALKDLGYSMNGPRGTLMVTIHDPLKVAQAPAHIFGEAVAKQVKQTWEEEHMSQKRHG
ncbi:uncharacterized protein FFB20_02456 [Fusarium fujikuroi]|uniref:Uncharacterized protein n=1 Tax=Gibberella fujikuroi (strain CBS 195.34 / IMI 58289 / NRRL A-6831) TaxID=1279085 RepID=S0E8U3_GIBF5|nr:uncharacterized protein FFUJ_06158 [Fusarium fujikuroi IMI 58289]SCN67045.1 uncharacterized protein FFB20_02456 [Fusarium fujikuroi]CCT70207.1 uncharacterized protein FFUJ_06158 [Fusarium fujikuroi IMI 58289]SCN82103.1 uncharacterized protein FFE2_04968 [Fusarium fujikuroi]SCN84712.1 uncharacterized protein FFM5_03458 [Fusarium fujikuroi]SCN84758.1 uncharacterized protein FFC1_04674 [Fusarium fujikuroi]